MSTRYNTGNPIESTDVRDMSDNAKNLDLFSNSSELSFSDRLGVERQTIYGMNSEFNDQILNMGFSRVGTFSSGATLTNPRQTLLWDTANGGDGQEYGWSGTFPKIVPPSSTPSSTGGIAVGAWMSRFDPELKVQVREALRRSYAEAGFNLVAGSFEAGGTVNTATDVLLHEAEGVAYSWGGALPKVIPAASSPASTGGVAEVAWRPVGDIESQMARWRNEFDVRGWGAKGYPADDTTAFDDTLAAALANGGAKIKIPAGRWIAQLKPDDGIYYDGAGRGVTVITQASGENRDIIKSARFDLLTGKGPLMSAPKNFGASNLTVDGNYLEDYARASTGGDSTVNNTAGYGVRIFGSKYHFDIEIVNCAQVGFYSEAYDYTGYGYEQDSTIRLSGRVFGKEAIVFRGPADINIEHVIIGCPGWLATESARNSTIVMSDLFPGEPVHVMVSDETVVGSQRYNGHHEFTFVHLYGNYNGYGYKTINTGRLKGSHLVCENCRGGAYFGNRVWGEVSIIECHSNGRNPSTLAGTLEVFPDIDVYSLQSFTFSSTIRRSQMEALSYIGLRSAGKLTRGNVSYYPIGTIPANSPVAVITSKDSEYDIMLNGVSGDAVSVAGVNNRVSVNGSDVTSGSLVTRVGGSSGQNRNNDIRINAHNVANILNLDGLVTTESIKIVGELNTGQTVVSGTAIDMVSRGISLDIAARVNGVLATSYDVGRVNLDNTVTTEQTITVSHNYFQTPDAAQISFNLYDPSPTYTGALQYLYLQSITATQLTFVYKLSAIGTGGPLVLCWRIQ